MNGSSGVTAPAAPTTQDTRLLSGYGDLKRLARTDSPAAITQVAKQFEALFMQMLVKGMRDTTTGEGLLESSAGRSYTDLYDQQMTLELAQRGGLGLTELIEQQLKQAMPTANGVLPSLPTAIQEAISSVPTSPSVMMNISQQQQVIAQNTLKGAIEQVREKIAASPEQWFGSPMLFAKHIWKQASEAAIKLNVSPVALVAQSALETGWGKHIPRNAQGQSSNNLFGIKAGSGWKGQTVSVATREFIGGQEKTLTQTFRAYSSVDESIKDYAALMQSDPRYQQALRVGKDPEKYVQALQDAGYATDPNYGRKLVGIMQGASLRDVMKELVL